MTQSLPVGWATASLSDVGDLHGGQSPSVSDVNRDGIGTPYVTGPDQWDGVTLHLDKWTTNPKRVVPDGCIFITVKGAGVGTLFPGVACAIGRDVYAFEPSPLLSRRFIEHSLRYNIAEVLRHAKGDIPGLSKGHILGHVTAFPPFNEQLRIVAKLDELFSDLDAGVAALKKAKANLKRYRAGRLMAAVDGTLTADWRATHRVSQTGSQLLEQILAERRRRWEADQLAKFEATEKTPPKNWQEKYVEPEPPDTSDLPELPEKWCWATLEAIAQLVGGITKDKKRSRQAGMKVIPYLRVANVQRGYLDLDEMKTIHASPEDIADLLLQKGDVLFTEGGDRDKLGRGWIWQEELPECIHQNHIFRARLIDSAVEPKFISHHGNTFGQKWFTTAGKQTTNLASINLGVLRRFPVPIPPGDEQSQIIAEVDQQLSVVDATLKQIDQDLIRAAQLRNGILKQAFEGNLVLQDPSDEPASTLLERIRQERVAKAVAEKGQRKGKRQGATNMTQQDRRPLLDVLKEHPRGLTPEELLRTAGYAISEVDDFYSELRGIVDHIEEKRPAGSKLNKWPKGARILLKATGD